MRDQNSGYGNGHGGGNAGGAGGGMQATAAAGGGQGYRSAQLPYSPVFPTGACV